jgi:hypothetical protein
MNWDMGYLDPNLNIYAREKMIESYRIEEKEREQILETEQALMDSIIETGGMVEDYKPKRKGTRLRDTSQVEKQTEDTE